MTAIGFMCGIVYAKYYGSEFGWLLWSWLLLALGAGYVLRKTPLILVIIFLVASVSGIARQGAHSAAQPAQSIDDAQYTKAVVTGTVVGEPFWDDKRNHVFYLKDLALDATPIAGELRVKSLVGNAREGYRVQVHGKVMPSLGKASSAISYAKVTVVSTQQDLFVQAKSEFSKGVRRALPEPAASFVLGILIGARSTLPKDLQDTMALIGLSHLVAVSGYNLTIITLAIQRILGKRWQWAGLVITLWLIVAFVILTGASASIVRAGIMSTLFLLATYYGRRLDVLTCLVLGIIVTLGWNPGYITDLGWQLSFSALGGIVLLTPAVQTFVPKRFGVIGEIAAVSIAAQLATMPLIAFAFGSLSVVAPLANVLVLPLVPLLMFVGFVVGVAGMLLPASAFALSWPIAWFVEALLDVMRYLGGIPRASMQGAAPHIVVVLIFYGLLCLLGMFARRRGLGSRAANAIITGMNERRSNERS